MGGGNVGAQVGRSTAGELSLPDLIPGEKIKAEAFMAAASKTLMISQESEQQDDRLGKLPDDVLISVLKHLSLRDAVRSSILSRRWRHIPSVLPDIVLDVESFEPNKDDGFTSTVSDLASSNMALAQAAKSVLGRKSDRPIGHLAVTFYLRKESMAIVRAVDDAMSPAVGGRGVVAAELTILGEKMDFLCNGSDMARNGRRFLSYFNACPGAFAGLTSLHVESVALGLSDIPNVLRTCEKLESPSLLNCDSGHGTVLTLEHPQLTDLQLCSCNTVELRWLPKLAQVACSTWVPSQDDRCPLLFGHVPLLRSVKLSTAAYVTYPVLLLSKLLANCTMLSELCIDFDSHRIWIEPEGPAQLAPLLQNLRIVTLDNIFEECDLTWTLFLLRAAPLLKTLQIKVSSHECTPLPNEMLRTFICEKKNIKWEPSDFKHNHLAVLEIHGFEGGNKFIGYIRRVMEAAVNLEVIILNDELCEHCGFRSTTGYPRTKKERDLIRKQISEGSSSATSRDVQFCEMSLEGRKKIVD
ncbi:hypothetical protein HU200_032315 [Digitaria exilis]|uniref:F-box domain-containing protein n=1 Tax=Digitaria exilis TaxID=1010633 RepID=A0A835BNJ0_9POAL|nr:hypothetical protein HU200_032315 [Digitaria exilis]CAB3487433.1 unnamed protein product [Digitaria exilis]